MLKRIIFLFICLSFTGHIKAWEDTGYFEEDMFDIFAPDADWEIAQRDIDCIPVCEVVKMLTNPGQVPPIILQERLKANLYKFTHPINTRSLLDLPQNYFFCCYQPEGWQFNGWIFYNQTSKGNWTKNGTQVSSYLDLRNASILQDIDQFEFDVDIPQLIDLFAVLKIQERRAGLMLGAYKIRGSFNVRFKTPLYYFERNFFITAQERRAIENSGFFDDDDDNKTDEAEIRKHMLSDLFGIGDTRLTLGYLVMDTPRMLFNVGAEFTIPTAWSWAKGMLGSNFRKNSKHSPLCLLELFSLGFCAAPCQDIKKIDELSTDFLVSAFDKISANILQTGLGNNGHIGMALWFQHDVGITQKFKFRTRSALEYLFPSSEKRFYITRKFNQEFDDRNYEDCSQALNNINFLNEQLILTLIPRVHDTLVWPGFIFKFTTGLFGNMGRNWQAGFGYDLWWQDKEKLGTIKATPAEIANLRVDIAQKPGAFQNKFFGSVRYCKSGKKYDWCLTFWGDKTFLRYGIGRDFNVSMRLELNL